MYPITDLINRQVARWFVEEYLEALATTSLLWFAAGLILAGLTIAGLALFRRSDTLKVPDR